jgi:hypothetical protein
VGYEVSCAVALADGKQFNPTASFDVYEPTSDFTTHMGKVITRPWTMTLASDIENLTGDQNAPGWGCFEMRGIVQVPAQFPQGVWAVAQIIQPRRERTLSDGTVQRNRHYGQWLLDEGPFPSYPFMGALPTGIYSRWFDVADSPGTGNLDQQVLHNGANTTITHVSAADEFDDYVLFKPAGDGSAWVPLKKIHWHWRGAATRQPDGSFQLDPFSDDAQALAAVEWNDPPIWTGNQGGDEFID